MLLIKRTLPVTNPRGTSVDELPIVAAAGKFGRLQVCGPIPVRSAETPRAIGPNFMNRVSCSANMKNPQWIICPRSICFVRWSGGIGGVFTPSFGGRKRYIPPDSTLNDVT